MRVGVACGSDDLNLLHFFKQLKRQGLLDYLELHVKPHITVGQIQKWRRSKLVDFLHPENGRRGNFVKRYLDIAVDTFMLSNVNGIVFDPGIKGDCFDLKSIGHNILDAHNLFPENMPYKTSLGDVCVGYMPSEMPEDFTFDISHAWIAANQLGLDQRKLVRDFFDTGPSHFHITDCKGESDHLLLGTGEIDWEFVINLLPNVTNVTIETDNVAENRTENIVKDLNFFRRMRESHHSS